MCVVSSWKNYYLSSIVGLNLVYIIRHPVVSSPVTFRSVSVCKILHREFRARRGLGNTGGRR